jgi:hypothetical protein
VNTEHAVASLDTLHDFVPNPSPYPRIPTEYAAGSGGAGPFL